MEEFVQSGGRFVWFRWRPVEVEADPIDVAWRRPSGAFGCLLASDRCFW
jgi:hypothetical protein